MKKRYTIPIEKLHLVAGFSLIMSGFLAYFTDGFEMTMSWVIFGAMYISMSDIGEGEMSEEKLNRTSHTIRRLFGYVGATFSLVLVFFYLNKFFLQKNIYIQTVFIPLLRG